MKNGGPNVRHPNKSSYKAFLKFGNSHGKYKINEVSSMRLLQ